MRTQSHQITNKTESRRIAKFRSKDVYTYGSMKQSPTSASTDWDSKNQPRRFTDWSRRGHCILRKSVVDCVSTGQNSTRFLQMGTTRGAKVGRGRTSSCCPVVRPMLIILQVGPIKRKAGDPTPTYLPLEFYSYLPHGAYSESRNWLLEVGSGSHISSRPRPQTTPTTQFPQNPFPLDRLLYSLVR